MAEDRRFQKSSYSRVLERGPRARLERHRARSAPPQVRSESFELGAPMTLELWLAFVAASSILLIIPGPTVLLVVSYALGQGWRTALPMAVGVALGDFTAMTLSMLGLGALLAASATL